MPSEHDVYVVPLGVSAALPHPGDANTYLAVVREGRYWLVDCADGPIQRLESAGLDPLAVEGIFITHFHPDHVYGLPAYALGLYLLAKERGYDWGRAGIPLCARPEVLSNVRALLGLFEPQGWLQNVPLDYHAAPTAAGATVIETDSFVVRATPTCHSTPSMAVRFEIAGTPRAFVYSSDTEPCSAVERLAIGADLLIHEATGEGVGHSDVKAAAEVAARAGVSHLSLIHYDQRSVSPAALLAQARKVFGGDLTLAEPYDVYPW